MLSASWLVSALLQVRVVVRTCWGRWAAAKLGFELMCVKPARCSAAWGEGWLWWPEGFPAVTGLKAGKPTWLWAVWVED